MLKQVVIADTSCLIVLSKIDAIWLLKELYQEVFITPEIAQEFGEKLPHWVIIEEVENKKYVDILQVSLDLGEASAIALAFEKKNALLILDDLKGRKQAEKLGFAFTGTLGILLRAKKEGFIEQIQTYTDKLKSIGFRVSPAIEKIILTQGGEIN